MKYLLTVLFFLLFITIPVKASADVLTGVQLPNSEAIRRLIPSQYSFKWVKFQYSLGSTQPLENLISSAKNYSVFISVAKNEANIIDTLKNPPYPETQANGVPAYTQKYCPWDDERDSYDEGTGEFYECGRDAKGKPILCEHKRTVPIPAKADNGYIKFRDLMQALAPRLQGAGAVEIWNEPNLAVEWTDQNLGPISPENYVNFMICGIKGLRKGGYTGKVISAGLAPLAPSDGTNMNDLDFFNRFVGAGGVREVDAIGWHSNVTDNSAPEKNPENGFQRFKYAVDKGKPVWLTEFGWQRDLLQSGDPNGSVARQLQAHYIAQAYDVINKSYKNKVETMIVWNFGFADAGRSEPEFALRDIEGTIPVGPFCQPNAKVTDGRVRGSTKYVQDTSLTKHVAVASVAGRALLPKEVINDATKSPKLKLPGTVVDVRQSFFDNLGDLFGIFSFLRNSLSNVICTATGQLCRPTLSIGRIEQIPPDGVAPGKNTPELASQSEILGNSAIPAGMKLTAEDKDCNIGQLDSPPDPGNEDLNTLSETLCTSTGFYGNGMVNFKTLTPNEWDASISAQMQEENLNIGDKLFNQDKRSPDCYIRKEVFCKGNYPNGICPFELTPTPILKPA